MVIWITGKANSGKTTMAKRLAKTVERPVILDGDEMRKIFPAGFKAQDREDNVMHLAKFAALLERQGLTPLVACVSPTKELRQKARQLFESSCLIYMPGGTLWPGTEYEEPDSDEL